MRRVIVLVIVVLALAGVAGYFILTPNATDVFASKTTVTDKAAIAKMTLGFVQNPYPDDYNVMRIPGWVQNLTSKRIASADIEIQMLDDAGNRKELVKYTLTDIAPRSRKTFDANGGTFSGPRKSTVRIVRLEVAN